MKAFDHRLKLNRASIACFFLNVRLMTPALFCFIRVITIARSLSLSHFAVVGLSEKRKVSSKLGQEGYKNQPGRTVKKTMLQSIVIPPAVRNIYFHVDVPKTPLMCPRPHEISGVTIRAAPFIPHQRLDLNDCSRLVHQNVT